MVTSWPWVRLGLVWFSFESQVNHKLGFGLKMINIFIIRSWRKRCGILSNKGILLNLGSRNCYKPLETIKLQHNGYVISLMYFGGMQSLWSFIINYKKLERCYKNLFFFSSDYPVLLLFSFKFRMGNEETRVMMNIPLLNQETLGYRVPVSTKKSQMTSAKWSDVLRQIWSI